MIEELPSRPDPTRHVDSARTPMEPPHSPPDAPVIKSTRDEKLTGPAGVEGPLVSRASYDPGASDSHSSIANLLGIPFEVFIQISSSLGLGDLLALARTCKSLRAFFMSKSRIAMWQNAERNTPRLPPCPTTMSQPQYAALVFMNECSLCGACTKITLEPKLRVRLCRSCHASELVDIYSIKNHELLRLIAHVPVTLKVPTMSKECARFNGVPMSRHPTPHCRRRDLETFRDTREGFLRSNDQDGLKRWELELEDLDGRNHQFAEMLWRFLFYPELTPMQEQWKKEGGDIDRVPYPTEAIWFNKYGAYVKDGDSDEDDHSNGYSSTDEDVEDTEENGHDRYHLLHVELQKAKPLAHPFRSTLEALGVKTDPLLAVLGLGLSIPHPFESIEYYPFPTTAAVLSWPCFSTLHELEPSRISKYFWAQLGHIIHHVKAWREDGERELVGWWKSGTGPTGDPANPIVKIRGSITVTENLSPNLRLLLRADTIFSYRQPGVPGGQGAHLHYPHFYQSLNEHPANRSVKDMNPTRMYRHLEAERITKALLRGLGMSDVAYIQLLLMGASLICGRCDDHHPRTWDQIIDHYRQETQLWTELQGRTPDFKTMRPLKFANVHDLNSASAAMPFVQRLTAQDVASIANSPPLGPHQGFCCILCRNYQVCHVFKNLATILTHMNDVHGIANLDPKLNYTSYASSATFSSWGQEWCDSWNAYQEAHEWGL